MYGVSCTTRTFVSDMVVIFEKLPNNTSTENITKEISVQFSGSVTKLESEMTSSNWKKKKKKNRFEKEMERNRFTKNGW